MRPTPPRTCEAGLSQTNTPHRPHLQTRIASSWYMPLRSCMPLCAVEIPLCNRCRRTPNSLQKNSKFDGDTGSHRATLTSGKRRRTAQIKIRSKNKNHQKNKNKIVAEISNLQNSPKSALGISVAYYKKNFVGRVAPWEFNYAPGRCLRSQSCKQWWHSSKIHLYCRSLGAERRFLGHIPGAQFVLKRGFVCRPGLLLVEWRSG